MDDFLEETRCVGQPIYLGILGKHETISKNDIHESILHPLISAMGRLPDKMYMPSDGLSSAYLSIWSDKHHIESQIVEADWKRFGRKAGFLRDSRILKESTHLLIFNGPRSKTNEATGIREAKKGKQVFLVDNGSLSITELVVED